MGQSRTVEGGVSPETLRKIESGRVATPSFSTVAALADVLGLPLDAMWAEIEPSEIVVDEAGSAHPARERLAS